jgi:hypothetical protein
MKRKLKKSERQLMGNAMVDSTRLRAALMIACTALTEGDPIEALELAEYFYDEAPELLKTLTADGIENLPGGPAQVLSFPNKPN